MLVIRQREKATIFESVKNAAKFGTQGSIKGAQLPQLLSWAKVTIFVFDEMQFVDAAKRWRPKDSWENMSHAFRDYLEIPDLDIRAYSLRNQMRMQCASHTKSWLDSLVTPGSTIASFPDPQIKWRKAYAAGKAYFVSDAKNYEIGVFESLNALKAAIQEKPAPSCLLATYDWEYKQNSLCGGLSWHETGKKSSMCNNLWTMAPEGAVGSIHDIQGFDLTYAGVILGPSVCYDSSVKYPGISFTPNAHQGFHNARKDNQKAIELISNELGVLLSRGVKGIYLYATNEKLRKALIEAVM